MRRCGNEGCELTLWSGHCGQTVDNVKAMG